MVPFLGCTDISARKFNHSTTNGEIKNLEQKIKPIGWCNFAALKLGKIKSKASLAFYKSNVSKLTFIFNHNTQKMLDELKEIAAEIDCNNVKLNPVTLDLIYDYSLSSNMINEDFSGARQRVKINLNYELQKEDINERVTLPSNKLYLSRGNLIAYNSFQVSSASYSYLHNQESVLEILAIELIQKLRGKLLYLYSQDDPTILEINPK